MSDLLVVGSGLFGLTIARKAAEELGLKVLILEKREHIGGNAYSEIDSNTGIEVHKYGSHLFHTSNEQVWEFVNRFTAFSNYQHKVWAKHAGDIYPLPINLKTINQFYKQSFTPSEARAFMSSLSSEDSAKKATNLEERAIGLIGRDLYEAFIKNYTAKQWQTDPQDLPAEVINRLPVRFNYEHRYFADKYEGLPLIGYSGWLQNMCDHENIEVRTSVDFLQFRDEFIGSMPIVYTGPVDEYFNFEFGQLGWRTLDFEYEYHEVNDFQGTSVMNYSDLDVGYTRIHEFKHLHPERSHTKDATVIAKEFSRFANVNDEPYYPINAKKDREQLSKYRELVKGEAGVYFGGRLGTYQYLDMHMAIASAFALYDKHFIND
jgi:UDP-galactopyranose mutase